MNLKLLPILFLTASLSSCSEGTANFETQYVDLKSLIEHSIASNSHQKPTFLKELFIDDKVEKITTAEIEWSKELEVFLAMDLNKRDYLNKYKVDSSAYLLNYTLLPEMEAPVKEMQIQYDSSANISKVSAVLKTNNFLYDSERNLTIYYKADELVNYEVSGWQELFIGDKKHYSIKAGKIIAEKKRGA